MPKTVVGLGEEVLFISIWTSWRGQRCTYVKQNIRPHKIDTLERWVSLTDSEWEVVPGGRALFMGWVVSHPKFICWSLYIPVSQNVTLFGDKAFKEVIQAKWGHTGGLSSSKKRKLGHRQAGTGKRPCEDMGWRWGAQGAGGQLPTNQRERAKPQKNQPSWLLVLRPPASTTWEHKILLFKPPSQWPFVKAAITN